MDSYHRLLSCLHSPLPSVLASATCSRRLNTSAADVLAGPGQETRWAFTPTLVKKWTDLEKLLISVLDCLSFQASDYKPKPYCPKASSPTLAASRSRDAFMPLFASVAMHFVLLDGSLQRDTWRSELIRKARLQCRLVDSLDEAVELVLQCPAGMIIDTSEGGMVQELGWLFSLLLNGEAKIHVPVYFFLGEDSQSAANRASWLESYSLMRHIAAYVQSDVGSLANLPPSPVKMIEYVYIKSTFRRWGVLPNPLPGSRRARASAPACGALQRPERGTELCRILRSTGEAECGNHTLWL
ncbi:hypothetical protein R3P38DRAFT_3191360 [Favolaschia claudopus]|uniref:Uncharacterized protein n=1 Tax=Favolaschia claudopus TaxID=2862362 RepID=A0AAW0BKT1_9AGAR